MGLLLLGGVFILGLFFVFFWGILFSLLASWLLGFLASWLLGFLASWLLGFLAVQLLGFWASGLLGFSAFCWFMRLLVAFWLFASSAFPVPLRQMAVLLLRLLLFAGLCGFWRLLAALAFCILRAFWLLRPFIGFLDLASRIISITTTPFESSLLRTSWRGNPPPTHPLLFRLFAE